MDFFGLNKSIGLNCISISEMCPLRKNSLFSNSGAGFCFNLFRWLASISQILYCGVSLSETLYFFSMSKNR